jgi:hypothetical protein
MYFRNVKRSAVALATTTIVLFAVSCSIKDSPVSIGTIESDSEIGCIQNDKNNDKNKEFYNKDGSFNQQTAKNAYYALMESFNYPVPSFLKTENFWVCDFLTVDFIHVGMGGVFWMNNKGVYGENDNYSGPFAGTKWGYLGHDIYLLPGQLLPEHRHIGGNEGFGPKMEGWHVRYGSVEMFAEYSSGNDEVLISTLKNPPVGFGSNWFKSKYAAPRNAGEFYKLGSPESWHCMRAGKNGAIVTEYATYHNEVEFSKPGMQFDNSKVNTIIKGNAKSCQPKITRFDGLRPFSAIPRFKNNDFYNPDGSYNGAAAKQAYFKMFNAYKYPIPAILQTDNFWTCDFLTRTFTTVGMGGIFWMNNKGVYGENDNYSGTFAGTKWGYLGHDIYLLPGQLLPEHRHIGGYEGFGPKMEGWHVRYGSVEMFAEYSSGNDEVLISTLANPPEGFGTDWFKSKYAAPRNAGEFYKLGSPESWHCMRAGINGAIVSEYATYHNEVEFSKPGMEFKGSGPK